MFDLILLLGLVLGVVAGKFSVVASDVVKEQLNRQMDQDNSDALHPPIWLPDVKSKWLDRGLVLTLTAITPYVLKRWHISIDAFAIVFFCASALTLAHIDFKTGLLPDVLTRPLLLAGLAFHSFDGWEPFFSSTLGAALAYGLLFGVFRLYYWKTGCAGMGHGDFKLAAAISAWLGIQSVPMLLLIASGTGVLVGVFAQYSGNLPKGNAFPFGPFLSVAGILIILWV